MQTWDQYPYDAVGGACFVSGRSKLEPGQKVVDIDRDLEDCPPFGRVVIGPEGVRQLNVALGWEILDEKASAKIKVLTAQNADLRTEVKELKEMLRAALDGARRVGIEVEPALEEATT